MTRARVASLGAVLVLAGLVVPEVASAHGLVGKQDLPMPRWLFAWSAAVVLVVSFVALAILWPKARLEGEEPRHVAKVPTVLDPLCGAIGVALFAVVVYAGLAGTPSADANLAPTAVYVVFWVGLAFASFVFGDVFKAFNPWRAIARFVAWLAGRAGFAGPAALPYPERLGRWPAVVTIAGFAWLELASESRDEPQLLGILALAYAAVQLFGMSLYGIDAWERRADGFAVYFGLFARVGVFEWRRGELLVRKPLTGLTTLSALPGTVALLCLMIGSTSFDGFTGSATWSSLAPDIQSLFRDLGLSQQRALEAAFTVGLAGAVAAVAGIYRLGVWGMRSVGGDQDARRLGRRFAHSLVPIALAYVVAHYFSLLAYQGQAVAFLASDPLGDGSDLLGTASSTIDYGWVGSNAIWYVQVGALVVGHAAGLVLAHDRALVDHADARRAIRSQYWMLAVMVGFTSLGLWLLSAAAQ